MNDMQPMKLCMSGRNLTTQVISRVMDYKVFKEFDIDRFVKKSDSILFTGCGNSSDNMLSN